MAAALWRSSNAAEWLASLQDYEQQIDAVQKDGLKELDSWYRSLPDTIAERKHTTHITADELVRIVAWKLKRGKWRPRLLDFARAHSDDMVRSASAEAFRLAASGTTEDASAALAPLTKLKGIGPATASAVLAVAQPAYPFMSDEAMAAAVQGPLKYTVPEYVQLVEALQGKAAELNIDSGEHVWTASDVERSLYSCAADGRVPTATKRKAEAKQPATKPKTNAKPADKRPVSKTGGETGAPRKRRR